MGLWRISQEFNNNKHNGYVSNIQAAEEIEINRKEFPVEFVCRILGILVYKVLILIIISVDCGLMKASEL